MFKQNKSNFLTKIIFIISLTFFCYRVYRTNVFEKFIEKSQKTTQQVNTIYGSVEVKEPVILDILNSQAMQRIKKVHQYGPAFFIKYKNNPEMIYTRYDHCVGVWFLLRKFGASIEEQIAGLLHDASHTVFSHVGDFLFKKQNQKDAYQDDIHEWYLNKTDIPDILKKYNITLEQVLHKNGDNNMLEQDLPTICADRLEYNLKGGLIEGMLSLEDVKNIVNDIGYEDGRWYFNDRALAKKLSLVPMRLSVTEWGGPETFLCNTWIAAALKVAIEINLISLDDVHFSTDDVVWKKLIESNNSEIKNFMYKAINNKKLFDLSDNLYIDYHIKTKFRGIDPWIKQKNFFRKLSEVDSDYEKIFTLKKTVVNLGWDIRFLGQAAEDKDKFKSLLG